GGGNRPRRSRRRVRRHTDARSVRSVASRRARGVEDSLLHVTRHARALRREGHDAVCPGFGPRLHARQSLRSRRRRVRRVVQPLAFRRGQCGERPRDRGREDRRSTCRLRGSAPRPVPLAGRAMTVVDLIVFAFVLASIAHGLRAGAAVQVASFAGLWGGLAIGAALAPKLSSLVTTTPARAIVALVTLFGSVSLLSALFRAVAVRLLSKAKS